MRKLVLPQCLLASLPVGLLFVCTTDISSNYKAIEAVLCVGNEFVETHPAVQSAFKCAALCSRNPRCQAFGAPDGDSTACRLFVFDACSRSVRSDCGCSQRGRLFVKQRSGLTSGSLCPSGFGHGRCGVKYMAYSGSGNWEQSRLRCESEPGLVVMADAADLAELSHLDRVRNESLSPQTSVWLGGLQQPGSAEPSGGWTWATCGSPIDSSLWTTGQPNNFQEDNATAIARNFPGLLVDANSMDARSTSVLCECVSPFD